MTQIASFNVDGLKTVTPSKKGPGAVLSGNPQFSTYMFSQERGKIGIWEITEGGYRMEYGENAYEIFTILEGTVEITEDGGAPITYTKGDTVVIRSNFKGNWRTIAPVRKMFVSL